MSAKIISQSLIKLTQHKPNLRHPTKTKDITVILIVFHFSKIHAFLVGVHCFSVADVSSDRAKMAELSKGSSGVGFSLEGGKSSRHGDRPLLVNRIFKGDLFSISLSESRY